MSKTKTLKRRLYIYVDGTGDESCFIATDDPSEHTGIIGVYELVETLEVRQTTEFRREKTKAWFK